MPDQLERINKVLASAGLGSRRECEQYVLDGRVTVDGKVVKDLATKINSQTQKILLDGEKLRVESKEYWWLNKSKGVLCTNRDPQGRPTVLDLIGEHHGRIYSVGRLDEDSTGLLLLTNDGALADRLTHPRYGVPKTYMAVVAGGVNNETLLKMREGIWLSDGKAVARDVRRMGMKGEATVLKIVLCEGHNREVRRMLAHFGHKVMQLERVAIGPLKIRQLKRGAARRATPDEVAMLQELARNPRKFEPKKRFIKKKAATGRPEEARATADRNERRPALKKGVRPERPGRPIRPDAPEGTGAQTGRPLRPVGPVGRPPRPVGPGGRGAKPSGEGGRPARPIGPGKRPPRPVGPDGRPARPSVQGGRPSRPKVQSGRPARPSRPGGPMAKKRTSRKGR